MHELLFPLCRGDDFRTEFARLGEVRSLLPPSVGIMALTATATNSLRRAVVKTLGMLNPVIIATSPDKPNLVLTVAPCGSLEETFLPVIKLLESKRLNFPRMLIYCQQQDHCARLYTLFKVMLGSGFTEPPGSHDIPQLRLVDMFVSGTHPAVREEITRCITSVASPLRILIATIAFGMGVNPPNVHYVLHYGPPNDVETYVQEIGRGGRDGLTTHSVLFHKKGLNRHAEACIRGYSENSTVCRRVALFKDFDEHTHTPSNIGCNCCDISVSRIVCVGTVLRGLMHCLPNQGHF